jgi:hypothetical protein
MFNVNKFTINSLFLGNYAGNNSIEKLKYLEKNQILYSFKSTLKKLFNRF